MEALYSLDFQTCGDHPAGIRYTNDEFKSKRAGEDFTTVRFS